MYTTRSAAAPAGHRAAVALGAVREQWGDLCAAIDTPPPREWPPRESKGFIEQAATDDAAAQPAAVGRLPFVLREHPAPLNLDALDAALHTETELFALADQIAAAVQRPVTRHPAGHASPGATGARWAEDEEDRADPRRWHFQAPTSPGSRAYGLHWAAVWLEGRVLDDDAGAGELFRPMPAPLLEEAAAVAGAARRRVEYALGREHRDTTLADPCPWCGGPLTGRSRSGVTAVTCATGRGCGAPVLLDERGRRRWAGADLVGLFVALQARRTGGG